MLRGNYETGNDEADELNPANKEADYNRHLRMLASSGGVGKGEETYGEGETFSTTIAKGHDAGEEAQSQNSYEHLHLNPHVLLAEWPGKNLTSSERRAGGTLGKYKHGFVLAMVVAKLTDIQPILILSVV